MKSLPENQLMINCSRLQIGAKEQERIQALLRGGIDWSRFIRLCAWHGVLPMAYKALRKSGQLHGSQWQGQLQNEYRTNYARNLARCQALLKILDQAEQAGLRPVVFKGPALGVLAYDDIGLRQFSDLDLLLNQSDLPPFLEQLLGLGFTPCTASSPAGIKTLLANHGQVSLIRPKDQLQLDIHLELSPRSYRLPYDLNSMLANSVRMQLLNGQITSFCREDHFIICSLHGTLHHWRRLKMLADLRALMRHPEGLEWQRIVSAVRSMRALGLVRLAISLMDQVFGDDSREVCDTELAPSRPTRKIAAGYARNFCLDPIEHPGARRGLINYLMCREHWTDRLVCVKRLLFDPNPEDLSESEGSAWLARLKRPVRVLKKYGL